MKYKKWRCPVKDVKKALDVKRNDPTALVNHLKPATLWGQKVERPRCFMAIAATKPLANNLREHRKKSGLSQREIGGLVGALGACAVSRHERFHAELSLRTALAYAAIFRVPVAELFSGERETIASKVEERIEALEESLKRSTAKRNRLHVLPRKVGWIDNRRRTFA
jgi:transcriptional regulator with XRE-family HTH domain